MYLPNTVWKLIYEFDLTYKLLYDEVIREIDLRYDNGRWWIRQSGLYVKGSRKYYGIYKTEWSKRDYAELNFLTRDKEYGNTIYHLHLIDVLSELKKYFEKQTLFNC